MIQLHIDIHIFLIINWPMCISSMITYVKAEVILCATKRIWCSVYKSAS